MHKWKLRVVASFATLALTATSSATYADEVYYCTDRNKDLHFVIYEDGDTPRGGHMYISGIQTAVLLPRRVNDITIRATVAGNTAKTELVFNRSRKQVFIDIGKTSKVVCQMRILDN